MANLFVNLPVPAGNGVGAAVDVSAMGGEKTITCQVTFTGALLLEFSVDGGATFAQITLFAQPSKRVFTLAAQFMRVRRRNVGAVPGVPAVDIASDNIGQRFVTLPVPAANGVGAAVDVTALGKFNTVTCLGSFAGIVHIEISEDGGTTFAQCMSFANPDFQSKAFTAQFIRVRRQGVAGAAVPGLPIVAVGAVTDAAAAMTLLFFGNQRVAGAADTRFISPGRDSGTAAMDDVAQIPVGRVGTLRTLLVRHNSANGNGNDVVYTVRVNGVQTALTVTLATGAIGQAADTVNRVAIAENDRVSLDAIKALAIGNSRVDVEASLEMVAT